MANTMTYELSNFGLGAHGGLFGRIRKAVEDYRVYRQTLGELEQLNDRELRDLGLSRFAIRDVAYDSVYGA